MNDRDCRVDKFHHYTIITDNDVALVEGCRACRRQVVYRKSGGRIDNRKYANDHPRDLSQPNDPLFRDTYGEKHTREIKEVVKKEKERTKRKEEIKARREELPEKIRNKVRIKTTGQWTKLKN